MKGYNHVEDYTWISVRWYDLFIVGGALSDILLFIVICMPWIIQVSIDGSLIRSKKSW